MTPGEKGYTTETLAHVGTTTLVYFLIDDLSKVSSLHVYSSSELVLVPVVGGPVISVLTVGVLPELGDWVGSGTIKKIGSGGVFMVLVAVGDGVGGEGSRMTGGLHLSSELNLQSFDVVRPFALQHFDTELYEPEPLTSHPRTHCDPS